MNSYQKKNIIYSVVLLASVIGVWLYRDARSASQPQEEASGLVTFSGQTMGTVYNIKYLDEQQRNLKQGVDSLLEVFNQSVNHYLPDSEISRFNRQDTFYFELPYFYPVLERSQDIYKKTGGAFDPTVAPLVNAWGFGPDTTRTPAQAKVDSLLQYVGMDKISFTRQYVTKTKPGVALNFSAIAKGYGVDVIAGYLAACGIQDLMVEIGGEVVARGVNDKGDAWRIGINNPEQSGALTAAIALNNRAIATSGDYLNFYVKDGKRYAHTIDPKTGFPVEHTALSVSVLADDCMTADGYATAFMVLGIAKAKEILQQNPSLDAYIIYDDKGEDKVFMTDGLKEQVLDL